jgi:hypothetical protein
LHARPDNESLSILFSGDIGHPGDLVFKPLSQLDGVDDLVM